MGISADFAKVSQMLWLQAASIKKEQIIEDNAEGTREGLHIICYIVYAHHRVFRGLMRSFKV